MYDFTLAKNLQWGSMQRNDRWMKGLMLIQSSQPGFPSNFEILSPDIVMLY